MFKIERQYPEECRHSREDAFHKTSKMDIGGKVNMAVMIESLSWYLIIHSSDCVTDAENPLT